MSFNIEEYTGLNVLDKLPEGGREIYMGNWNQLHINYGDNVEWQKLKKQVWLCDATREYLYAKPQPVKYVKGSRPYLEKKVATAIEGCTTDREKVIALMSFIRDLYKHSEAYGLFYGGTEEELIKKGENLCECLGRLMVSLCEILGFPGRIVMHLSGHIVCEIYIEDRWAFFDARHGFFFLDENDQFLSIDALIHNHAPIKNQKDWVRAYASEKFDLEKSLNNCDEKYFNPREIQLYCPYSLMDADEYNYEWRVEPFEGWDPVREAYLTAIKNYYR